MSESFYGIAMPEGVVTGTHWSDSPHLAAIEPDHRALKSPEPSTIAAIVYADHCSVDNLLADFAFGLRRDGWIVEGLVQQYRGSFGKESAVLVDLDNGQCFPLFQHLGSGSGSCSIDSGSIAAASVVLRRALATGADLAIANRFGALEAAGGGLAAEMLALMSEGQPVLTVVADRHLADWRHFSGQLGVELPPRLPALEAWFAGLGRKQACR